MQFFLLATFTLFKSINHVWCSLGCLIDELYITNMLRKRYQLVKRGESITII